MLTFSKFLDVFANQKKMKISQNNLSHSFETSPARINAWLKDAKIRRKPDEIYLSIDDARERYTEYKNDSKFANTIIDNLEITNREKNHLHALYNQYRRDYDNDASCNKSFITELIQKSLNEEEILNTILYDKTNFIRPVIAVGGKHIIMAREDGLVRSSGSNDYQQCDTHSWKDIVSAAAGWSTTMGLKNDGTCIAIGKNIIGNGEIFRWHNIISICCGTYHFLGLRDNGTVTACGISGEGQCEVSEWEHIKEIAAGTSHTVGLRENGTVVSCGRNDEGQCNTGSWKNVMHIWAAGNHTTALTRKGEILFTGENHFFQFIDWNDVTSIAVGLYYIAGLKRDGSVLLTGFRAGGLDQVYRWSNIAAIYGGFHNIAGLKEDGTVLVTNDKHASYYLDTRSWNIYGSTSLTKKKEQTKFDKIRIEAITELDIVKDFLYLLDPFIQSGYHQSDAASVLVDNIILSTDTISSLKQAAAPYPTIEVLLGQYEEAFKNFKKMIYDDDYKNQSLAKDECNKFLVVIENIVIVLKSL